jgi:hypothetical protein
MAAISLAIGVGCLAGARVGATVVCRTADLKYYPRFGFTFLWRLSFLRHLSEPQRTALLDQVEARTTSSDARKFIAVVRQSLPPGSPLQAQTVVKRLREVLSNNGKKVKAQRAFEALNHTAVAFLSPPPVALWRAAEKDFAVICRIPLSATSSFLFSSTSHYFSHKDLMPEVARLSTFQQYTANELQALPQRLAYFRLGKELSLNGALTAFAIEAVGLLLISRGTSSILPG